MLKTRWKKRDTSFRAGGDPPTRGRALVLTPTEEGPTLGARRGQREERGLAPAEGGRDPGAARGFLPAVPSRSQEQDRGRPGSRARPSLPAGSQVPAGRVGSGRVGSGESQARPRPPRPAPRAPPTLSAPRCAPAYFLRVHG